MVYHYSLVIVTEGNTQQCYYHNILLKQGEQSHASDVMIQTEQEFLEFL